MSGPVATLVVVVIGAAVSLAAFPTVMWWLAGAGGWRTLAATFPARPPAPDADGGLGSIALRGWCGYNGCVRWRADDECLHLGLPRMLAFAHRPMSIPWGRVEFPRDLSRLGRAVTVHVEGVAIRLPREMVRRELEVRRAIEAEASASTIGHAR